MLYCLQLGVVVAEGIEPEAVATSEVLICMVGYNILLCIMQYVSTNLLQKM
jgi:hypothetical protein